MQSTEVKHLLVVDDDEEDFFILKEAIETCFPSVAVSYLSTCDEADKAIFEHVDLVLLDINMPKITGFECLSLIRQEYGLTNLPVIMFTNSFAADDVRKAYQGGANLFVNKPMTFDTTKMFIKEMLSIDWSKIDELTRQNVVSNRILKYW